jgi:hypothetical protein
MEEMIIAAFHMSPSFMLLISFDPTDSTY